MPKCTCDCCKAHRGEWVDLDKPAFVNPALTQAIKESTMSNLQNMRDAELEDLREAFMAIETTMRENERQRLREVEQEIARRKFRDDSIDR